MPGTLPDHRLPRRLVSHSIGSHATGPHNHRHVPQRPGTPAQSRKRFSADLLENVPADGEAEPGIAA